MDRIRELVRRYPIAAGALIAALVAAGGWQAYQAVARPPQAAAPQAGAPPPAQAPGSQTAPRAPGTSGASGAPKPGTPGSAAATGTSSAPGAGTAPGSSQAAEEGRSNPFAPLVGQGGEAGQPLPPVPPLAPGAPGGPPGAENAIPGTQFRLAGILAGAQPLAIIEDGKSSYIVATGDVFASGAEVVAIDVRRDRVQIKVNGTITTLTLQAASPSAPSPPPGR